jgi:hypothetical protein
MWVGLQIGLLEGRTVEFDGIHGTAMLSANNRLLAAQDGLPENGDSDWDEPQPL